MVCRSVWKTWSGSARCGTGKSRKAIRVRLAAEDALEAVRQAFDAPAVDGDDVVERVLYDEQLARIERTGIVEDGIKRFAGKKELCDLVLCVVFFHVCVWKCALSDLGRGWDALGVYPLASRPRQPTVILFLIQSNQTKVAAVLDAFLDFLRSTNQQ